MHPISLKALQEQSTKPLPTFAAKMNHLEFMRMAETEALKSVCKRAQVGAVVVVNAFGGQIIGRGHNARPCGTCCEGEDGKTLPDVLHAEQSALNAMRCVVIGGELLDLSGATLYVTRQPCLACAQLIVVAGIKQVYYRDADDKQDGLQWLDDHGVSFDSRWIQGQVQDRYYAGREGRQ